MSCLLPIKVISISSPAVIRSLVQTSTPVQFSTLRRPGLIQSESLKQPRSRDRLHVQSVKVPGPFVSAFKEFLTLACFHSFFQSVPAQFPSFFGSDVLKNILVAKGTDFPLRRHTCTIKKTLLSSEMCLSPRIKKDSRQENKEEQVFILELGIMSAC